MIILSIDPGESMIGYAITKDKTVLRWGHIKRQECKKPSKIKEFIKDKIENIVKQDNINHIIIEMHTNNDKKRRNDENEIIDAIQQLNIPYNCYQADQYLSFLNLNGYDKKIDSLFRERQKEVYKYFKVKTNSRHNIDCLLMTIFFVEGLNSAKIKTL